MQGMTICSRPQTDATHGLVGRQRERLATLCGQKRGRGCGGGAPGAMATHENGRHQYRERATRKGDSSRFFDYAVILLLELSAFADWVESESVYPIPPISKVL